MKTLTVDEQVELYAQRYVFHLSKFADTDDADAWALVLKILENVARKGLTDRVVSRAQALIASETSVDTDVPVVIVS